MAHFCPMSINNRRLWMSMSRSDDGVAFKFNGWKSKFNLILPKEENISYVMYTRTRRIFLSTLFSMPQVCLKSLYWFSFQFDTFAPSRHSLLTFVFLSFIFYQIVYFQFLFWKLNILFGNIFGMICKQSNEIVGNI